MPILNKTSQLQPKTVFLTITAPSWFLSAHALIEACHVRQNDL
jgi:hypothetical protein